MSFWHRGKLKVIVLSPLGPKTYWKKPTADQKHIVMEEGKGKYAGWKFKIAQVIKNTVYVHYQAPESITFTFDPPTADQPHWDKKTSKEFINKKILDKAGEEQKDKGAGALLWVILIVSIVGIIINFLLSSGRLRL
jgi:hypothetical protein